MQMERDIIEYIGMTLQFVIFLVRPFIVGIYRFLEWSVRNFWFFVTLFLFAFIYLERIGLGEETVPDKVRVLFLTPIQLPFLPPIEFGYCLLFFLVFILFIYFYSVVKRIFVEVVRNVKSVISITILLLLYIYLRVLHIDNDEFIALEGAITWKDVVKVGLILLCIGGGILGLGFLKDYSQSAIADTARNELFVYNGTNSTENISYNGVYITFNVSDSEFKPRQDFTVNLTTEEYGVRVIRVSGLMDRFIERLEKTVVVFLEV